LRFSQFRNGKLEHVKLDMLGRAKKVMIDEENTTIVPSSTAARVACIADRQHLLRDATAPSMSFFLPAPLTII
jgi:hypothetical protein